MHEETARQVLRLKRDKLANAVADYRPRSPEVRGLSALEAAKADEELLSSARRVLEQADIALESLESEHVAKAREELVRFADRWAREV